MVKVVHIEFTAPGVNAAVLKDNFQNLENNEDTEHCYLDKLVLKDGRGELEVSCGAGDSEFPYVDATPNDLRAIREFFDGMDDRIVITVADIRDGDELDDEPDDEL